MAVHVTLTIHHNVHEYSARAHISAPGWRDTATETVTGLDRAAVSKAAKVKIAERARLLVSGAAKPESHPIHGLSPASTSESYTLNV
jgi:hypothetical protein